MSNTQKGPTITQLEFDNASFALAEEMAKKLGYTQTAYTTSSGLWGLFCLRDNPRQRAACIIRTFEFGMLVVMDCEDINMSSEIEWRRERRKKASEVTA